MSQGSNSRDWHISCLLGDWGGGNKSLCELEPLGTCPSIQPFTEYLGCPECPLCAGHWSSESVTCPRSPGINQVSSEERGLKYLSVYILRIPQKYPKVLQRLIPNGTRDGENETQAKPCDKPHFLSQMLTEDLAIPSISSRQVPSQHSCQRASLALNLDLSSRTGERVDTKL